MRKVVVILIISMLLGNIGLANDRDRTNMKIITDAIQRNDSILHLMDSSIVYEEKLNGLYKRLTSLIDLDFRIEKLKNLCDSYNINIRSYQYFYDSLDRINDISWQDYQDGKSLYSIVQLSKNNLIFVLENQVVIDNLKSVQSNIDSTYKEIKDANTMIEKSSTDIGNTSNQIDSIMNRINEVRDRIVMASDNIENVSINLDSLNRELKSSIEKIEYLDVKITNIHKDINQRKKQINKWGIGLGVGNLAALVLLIFLL
jgi:methyl-accepting chemotaxis protein